MPIVILVFKFFHCWFKTQRNLAIENIALKQQVVMLRRSVMRPRVSMADKLFWIWLSKYKVDWRNVLHALHPDTVVRWHRAGFRRYWRWKSHSSRPGRPPIDKVLRQLIRDMQATNAGWGAPRIHGELLKLGIDVS